jgi:hypothetical protein
LSGGQQTLRRLRHQAKSAPSMKNQTKKPASIVILQGGVVETNQA